MPANYEIGVPSEVMSWSPAGNLLLAGNTLRSPGGAAVKELGDRKTQNYVFSGRREAPLQIARGSHEDSVVLSGYGKR